MFVHEARAGLWLPIEGTWMNISKRILMVCACLGIACPQAISAEDVASAAAPKTARQNVSDVSLRTEGVLVGHVVNAQGEPVAGAKVTVLHGRDVIATTSSNRTGDFIVRKLRGGVHHVKAGQGSAVVRLWTNKVAPPSSRSSLTIVSDKSVVRGQCGDAGCSGDCGTEGCGGAAGAFGGSGGGGLFGLGGGGMSGVAGVVATAAVVGGVLAVTLDDPASP